MQDRTFQLLLYKIKNERGFDFLQYRPALLKRRIDARLKARRVDNYIEYIGLLNREPEEYEKLIDVATINVTEFFRDPAAWQVVRDRILPGLIQNKDQKGQRLIRVWSAGTSGGEEAYTLAILLRELLGECLKEFRVKIYGTDIDRASLERAKLGEYPPESVRNVSPSLLKKIFYFYGKIVCGDRFSSAPRSI